jgi:GT2 family glycosyltransferase
VSAVLVDTAPPRTLEVAVIICAYADERWHQLVRAVESVRTQTAPPTEIVVAVDHNPGLAARARAELDAVIVVENEGTRGLSGARNAGVGASMCAIVAFLDDDAVAAPDWLERLAGHYDDPRTLGVGGAIDPEWAGGRPARFPREFDWVVGCTHQGVREELGPVRNMVGANMSLRREVFDAVGGFTTGIGRVGRLPVGCEETELCIRARQQSPQADFLFEPAARVAHHVPAERSGWGYFRRRCFAEGLSKARVAASTGADDALATERSYVARTLPAGVARGLRDAARGDATGLARAGLIVAGLCLTAAGYAIGTLRETLR